MHGSSRRLGSQVSSERLVTRTEFSSFLCHIESPVLSEPPLRVGGTYAYAPLDAPPGARGLSDVGMSVKVSVGDAWSL
jgi:hypothetical protein